MCGVASLGVVMLCLFHTMLVARKMSKRSWKALCACAGGVVFARLEPVSWSNVCGWKLSGGDAK